MSTSDAEGPTIDEGQVLGDVTLVQRAARDGVGETWVARHAPLEVDVLVHLGAVDDDRLTRLARDVHDCHATLEHPSIASFLAAGVVDGVRWVAEEYCGSTLAERSADGPLQGNRVAELMVDVGTALQHAHDSGCVHGSLCPASVQMADDGRVLLGDFGHRNALITATLTDEGPRRHWLARLPPEEAADPTSTPDEMGDVYRCGLLMYELLTGRVPFGGLSAATVRRQVLHVAPEDPRRLAPSVSRELSTLVLAALDKRPGRRPHSVEALVADLLRVLDGERVHAHRPSSTQQLAEGVNRQLWTRTVPWVERHRSRVIGGVAGGLVLAALVGAITGGDADEDLPDVYAADRDVPERAAPRLTQPPLSGPLLSGPANTTAGGLAGLVGESDRTADIPEPLVAKPDVAKPDVAKPDVAKPDIAKPDIAKQDIAESGIPGADLSDADELAAVDRDLQPRPIEPVVVRPLPTVAKAALDLQMIRIVIDAATPAGGVPVMLVSDGSDDHVELSELTAVLHGEALDLDGRMAELARDAHLELTAGLAGIGPGAGVARSTLTNWSSVLRHAVTNSSAPLMPDGEPLPAAADTVEWLAALADAWRVGVSPDGVPPHLGAVAELYARTGDLDAAEGLFRLAERLEPLLAGLPPERQAATQRGLARLLAARGDLDGAAWRLRDVVSGLSAGVGPDHPLAIAAAADLSRVMNTRGASAEAAVWSSFAAASSAAVPKDRANADRPRGDAERLAEGVREHALGCHDAALDHYREVARVDPLALAPSAEDRLAHRLTVAALLDAGRWERAHTAVMALAVSERTTLGGVPPDVVVLADRVARAAELAGQPGAAVDVLNLVWTEQRWHAGQDSAEALDTQPRLARALSAAGRVDEAVDLLDELVRSYRVDLGMRDGRTGAATASLLALYRRHGRLQEAETLLATRVLGLRASVPAGDQRLLEALRDHAELLLFLDRPDEAAAELDESARASREASGPRDEATLDLLVRLAAASRLAGRVIEAATAASEAHEGMVAVYGAQDPRALAAMAELARITRAAGDDAGAEQLLEDLLALGAEVFESSDPRRLDAIEQLALLFESQQRSEEARALADVLVAETPATDSAVDVRRALQQRLLP